MITISHLGTFDVENYGDLLYPLVFRQILKGRDARLKVRHYSLLDGDAPQEAGFKTHAARSLFEAGRDAPSRIVVGGGDILRTDWKTVAAHYGRAERESSGRLRGSPGTAGLLRRLMRKSLNAFGGSGFYADRFRQRRMSYPAAGPFIIEPADLP